LSRFPWCCQNVLDDVCAERDEENERKREERGQRKPPLLLYTSTTHTSTK
jgi:hypothetical protein